jgi:hypothetical protein
MTDQEMLVLYERIARCVEAHTAMMKDRDRLRVRLTAVEAELHALQKTR